MPTALWNFNTFSVAIESMWNLIEAGKLPKLLSKIKVPVVHIHGDSDPIPAYETISFLSNYINDFKSILIEKAGHFPWIEPSSHKEFLLQVKNEILG